MPYYTSVIPNSIERYQLAKPNYSFEKRQKELAKKQKMEEKRKRKLGPEPEPENPPSPEVSPKLPDSGS
jgi:hypothetical protein